MNPNRPLLFLVLVAFEITRAQADTRALQSCGVREKSVRGKIFACNEFKSANGRTFHLQANLDENTKTALMGTPMYRDAWALVMRSPEGSYWMEPETGLVWSSQIGNKWLTLTEARGVCSTTIYEMLKPGSTTLHASWSLPSPSDYATAEGHGIRRIIDLKGENLWSVSWPELVVGGGSAGQDTTLSTTNGEPAIALFDGGSGEVTPVDQAAFALACCIGVVN
jgi:hypothetical protein